MITMSKPISASQRESNKEEFANARDNYYSEGDHVRGECRASSPSVTDLLAKWARSSSRVE